MKTCKGCRHALPAMGAVAQVVAVLTWRRVRTSWECSHQKATIQRSNIVTGDVTTYYTDCDDMRHGTGACGPDAKLHEERK